MASAKPEQKPQKPTSFVPNRAAQKKREAKATLKEIQAALDMQYGGKKLY